MRSPAFFKRGPPVQPVQVWKSRGSRGSVRGIAEQQPNLSEDRSTLQQGRGKRVRTSAGSDRSGVAYEGYHTATQGRLGMPKPPYHLQAPAWIFRVHLDRRGGRVLSEHLNISNQRATQNITKDTQPKQKNALRVY